MEHNLGPGTVFKIELQRACTEHPFGFLGKLPESDFVGIFFFRYGAALLQICSLRKAEALDSDGKRLCVLDRAFVISVWSS